MDTPDFYNDLTLSLAEAKYMIAGGAKDRRSPAHHPAVASVNSVGIPQQRVMILRDVDWPKRALRFHTDSRSSKVSQIAGSSGTSILIYDEPAKVQLRLTGTAHVETGEIADLSWQSSTTFARRCYMAEAAPGSISGQPTSGLPKWIEGKQPDESQLIQARENFAALVVTINNIEWLYLANAGHRRATWDWHEAELEWLGRWLVP